jgi:Uma2 family endonuclease
MNIALGQSWTQDKFFAWYGHGEGRYEFDGIRPVAMTAGTIGHSRIVGYLHACLRARLDDSNSLPLGPDAGMETVGSAIRYPDAVVTCSKFKGSAYTVPGVVAVFEVSSRSSGHIDRIVKVREYAGVPSIRRYVILESTCVGLTVLHRQDADQPWFLATVKDTNDMLRLPEIGIEIPVEELYAGIDFGDDIEGG